MSKKVPRVLLIADSLHAGKGGISRVARLMAKVLAERAQYGSLHAEGITLSDTEAPADIHLPMQTFAGSRGRFVLSAIRHGFSCRHVIFDAPPLAQLEALPPLRWRPSLGFVHGIEVWENAPAKYVTAAKRLRFMLANSEFTKMKAESLHGGFARARTCWLATEEDEPPADSLPLSSRPPAALIVGRLIADRPKGHRELIACWPAVVYAVPDAVLHIVGGGPDRPALESLAKCSPAASNIQFHGFVPDDKLCEHYANVRLLAMPSRGEGFGLVYIEAMRHGLPVIGSILDAASEVLVDGETGFTVDQNDLSALQSALIQLLKDDDWAARMGAAGRSRWLEHFRFGTFRR
ncbi:MAG: glycosyltransferase family 4 protein, partial [Candidatus Acidiferrum sp.]